MIFNSAWAQPILHDYIDEVLVKIEDGADIYYAGDHLKRLKMSGI